MNYSRRALLFSWETLLKLSYLYLKARVFVSSQPQCRFVYCKWRRAPEVSRFSLISSLDGLIFIIHRHIVSMASWNGGKLALRLIELNRFELDVVLLILWFRFGECLEIVWRRARNHDLIQRILIIEFEHRARLLHCPSLLLSKSHSSSSFSFFAKF